MSVHLNYERKPTFYEVSENPIHLGELEKCFQEGAAIFDIFEKIRKYLPSTYPTRCETEIFSDNNNEVSQTPVRYALPTQEMAEKVRELLVATTELLNNVSILVPLTMGRFQKFQDDQKEVDAQLYGS